MIDKAGRQLILQRNGQQLGALIDTPGQVQLKLVDAGDVLLRPNEGQQHFGIGGLHIALVIKIDRGRTAARWPGAVGERGILADGIGDILATHGHLRGAAR